MPTFVYMEVANQTYVFDDIKDSKKITITPFGFTEYLLQRPWLGRHSCRGPRRRSPGCGPRAGGA